MFRYSRLLLAAALTSLGVLATGCSSGGGTTYEDISPGQNAPQITAGWRSIDPIEVDLPTDDPIRGATAPDLTGPVLVNIWASTCPPCKKELPLLQKLDAAGDLTVIGFSRDLTSSRAEEALDAAGVDYPNWLDPDATLALGLDGKVPVNAVPSSFLIRHGKAVAVHIGEFKTRADVLAALEQS